MGTLGFFQFARNYLDKLDRYLMSSLPYWSVTAEIENMNLVLPATSIQYINKSNCGKYCLYSVQMFCLEDKHIKYTHKSE